MLRAEDFAWAAPLAPISDPELRNALVGLFVRADELCQAGSPDGRPPVVILVSRRLSCVHDMLASNGMELFHGCHVVTDRALDAGASNIKGRRVVLIDDCIVLGTTLANLYLDVLRLVGNDKSLVTAMVAAVDNDRYDKDFAHHLGIKIGGTDGAVLRSTKELEAFAFEVASSLYRGGMPYFTDFPACASVSTSWVHLSKLLTSERWLAANVTAPSRFAGERQAWSLVPRPETIRRIRSRGVPPVTAVADFFKLRVYFTRVKDRAEDVRVVPIGVPGGTAEAHLNELVSVLEDQLGTRLRCSNWHPRAKHRLVQMYLSSCLLAEAWPEIAPLFGRSALSSEVLQRRPLAAFFGIEDSSMIFDAFDAAVRAYATTEEGTDGSSRAATIRPRSRLGVRRNVRHEMLLNRLLIDATEELAATNALSVLDSAVDPREPQVGAATRVDPMWALFMLLVFGFVDKHLERRQEEERRWVLFEDHKQQREADSSIDAERILQQGITIHELRAFLTPKVDMRKPWEAGLVALAIDIGNDLGIVVPTTMVSDHGIVSRQYRSGETGYLATQDVEDLVNKRAEDIVELLNPYSSMVVEDLVRHRPTAAIEFSEDLSRIIRHALPGELLQAWHGVVRSRQSNRFDATVESRLTDGDSDIADLPIEIVFEPERPLVQDGAAFEWTVWTALDDVGKPQLTSRVRLSSRATSAAE